MYLSGKEADLSSFQRFYHLRQHQLPTPSPLKMDWGKFSQSSKKNLNERQKQAVSNIDAAVSFVVGPPGTGKTTCITAMVTKLLLNGEGVVVLGQTNNCVKEVAQSLLRNSGCPKDVLTLLVSSQYWSTHNNEYDSSYTSSEIDNRYTPVLLCTLSMAKRVKPDDLQKFRVKDDNGRFEFRSTVIVDEANRIGECSFAEVLPLLGPFKRLSI